MIVFNNVGAKTIFLTAQLDLPASKTATYLGTIQPRQLHPSDSHEAGR
jgi:hypothetical protein